MKGGKEGRRKKEGLTSGTTAAAAPRPILGFGSWSRFGGKHRPDFSAHRYPRYPSRIIILITNTHLSTISLSPSPSVSLPASPQPNLPCFFLEIHTNARQTLHTPPHFANAH